MTPTPAPAEKTRRRSREELRKATLDAARRIIAESGPEALTARRLASDVGYTAGTIYNLFDSLPDVLWHVNHENFARIAALFGDLPGQDATARLRALAGRYLDLVQEEPSLFRAIFEGPRVSESFPQWYTDAIDDLMNAIAAEVVQIAPDLSPSAARQEAARLFAAIQGIASLYVSGRLPMITDAGAKELADGLVARVLGDLARDAHG